LAGDTLLLAHHRGDQAETVLFNLLRGAGVTGAAGIPAERRFGASFVAPAARCVAWRDRGLCPPCRAGLDRR
jgi:tRNA(Ile)-lysidine synthase TilS/MesJ